VSIHCADEASACRFLGIMLAAVGRSVCGIGKTFASILVPRGSGGEAIDMVPSSAAKRRAIRGSEYPAHEWEPYAAGPGRGSSCGDGFNVREEAGPSVGCDAVFVVSGCRRRGRPLPS
jgi:hypothetical protein